MKLEDVLTVLRGLPRLTRAQGNQRWGSYSLVILAPIRAGERDALAGHLRATEAESPLAALEEVHFGRWLVIDQLKTGFKDEPRRPSRLDRPYLLFTADYTPLGDGYATPGTLLERVAGLEVWDHCDDIPDTHRERVRYLARHRCDTTLYYAGYPAVTPARVRSAVRHRNALAAFVLAHRDVRDPATLQRLYLQEAATWH